MALLFLKVVFEISFWNVITALLDQQKRSLEENVLPRGASFLPSNCSNKFNQNRKTAKRTANTCHSLSHFQKLNYQRTKSCWKRPVPGIDQIKRGFSGSSKLSTTLMIAPDIGELVLCQGKACVRWAILCYKLGFILRGKMCYFIPFTKQSMAWRCTINIVYVRGESGDHVYVSEGNI